MKNKFYIKSHIEEEFNTYNFDNMKNIPIENTILFAKLGDAERQFYLGKRYYPDLSKRDEAVYWLKKAADQGYIDAMFHLALEYISYRQSKYNDAKKLFLETLKAKHIPTLYHLSVLYKSGNRSFERDMVKSYVLMTIARILGKGFVRVEMQDVYKKITGDELQEASLITAHHINTDYKELVDYVNIMGDKS